MQATPTSTIGADTQLLYRMVDDYNRRFSGEPRSVCMETEKKKYICIRISGFEYISAQFVSHTKLLCGLCKNIRNPSLIQGPPANRAIFKCLKNINSIGYHDTVTFIRKYIL